MSFIRDRLPDALDYFAREGLELSARGKWRTARCVFHDGSDSMRINTQTGGFCCMVCEAKGGDVLAFHMQRHGLGFVDACKALGAWEGQP